MSSKTNKKIQNFPINEERKSSFVEFKYHFHDYISSIYENTLEEKNNNKSEFENRKSLTIQHISKDLKNQIQLKEEFEEKQNSIKTTENQHKLKNKEGSSKKTTILKSENTNLGSVSANDFNVSYKTVSKPFKSNTFFSDKQMSLTNQNEGSNNIKNQLRTAKDQLNNDSETNSKTTNSNLICDDKNHKFNNLCKEENNHAKPKTENFGWMKENDDKVHTKSKIENNPSAIQNANLISDNDELPTLQNSSNSLLLFTTAVEELENLVNLTPKIVGVTSGVVSEETFNLKDKDTAKNKDEDVKDDIFPLKSIKRKYEYNHNDSIVDNFKQKIQAKESRTNIESTAVLKKPKPENSSSELERTTSETFLKSQLTTTSERLMKQFARQTGKKAVLVLRKLDFSRIKKAASKNDLPRNAIFFENNCSNKTDLDRFPLNLDQTEKNLLRQRRLNRTGNNLDHNKEKMSQTFNTAINKNLYLFNCKKCSLAFKKDFKLKSHLRLTHNITSPYSCRMCDVDFRTTSGMKRHLKNVHEPHACNVCKKRFSRKKLLVKHLLKQHPVRSDDNESSSRVFELSLNNNIEELKAVIAGEGELTIFRCGLCGQSFKTRTAIGKHIETKHSKKAFERVQNDNSNLNLIKDSSFKCQYCNETFSSETLHENHVNSIHKHVGKINPSRTCFKCETCKKEFTHKGYYEKHLRMAHKSNKKDPENKMEIDRDVIDTQLDLKSKKEKSRNIFKCRTCGKVFDNQSQIAKHMRSDHLNFKEVTDNSLNVSGANDDEDLNRSKMKIVDPMLILQQGLEELGQALVSSRIDVDPLA